MDSTSNSFPLKKFIQDFLEISCLFTLRDAAYPKNMQQIQSAKIHLYSHLLVAVLRINKRKMHDVGFIPAYWRISSFITSFSPSETMPSLIPSSSLPLYSPLPSFASLTGVSHHKETSLALPPVRSPAGLQCCPPFAPPC